MRIGIEWKTERVHWALNSGRLFQLIVGIFWVKAVPTERNGTSILQSEFGDRASSPRVTVIRADPFLPTDAKLELCYRQHVGTGETEHLWTTAGEAHCARSIFHS